MTKPRYGPADAFLAPRYTGVRTFARCPHTKDLADVDVAVVGVPFDTGTSFRVGARFGPEAVRTGSTLLRPYNANLQVDCFATQSVIDWGDADTTPGDAPGSVAQIAAQLEGIVRAGVTPIVLGGDHTIALAELRAHAAVHGPVALVLLDAHCDTNDRYYGQAIFHGTPFRRAVEEGLILPEQSVMAGMRGPLYDAEEWELPRRELGFDVIDPCLAPGTGTPEAAGLMPYEALRYVRALAGLPFVGYDVVEVSPQLDGPGGPTAILAANVAYEFLGMNALKPGR